MPSAKKGVLEYPGHKDAVLLEWKETSRLGCHVCKRDLRLRTCMAPDLLCRFTDFVEAKGIHKFVALGRELIVFSPRVPWIAFRNYAVVKVLPLVTPASNCTCRQMQESKRCGQELEAAVAQENYCRVFHDEAEKNQHAHIPGWVHLDLLYETRTVYTHGSLGLRPGLAWPSTLALPVFVSILGTVAMQVISVLGLTD